MPPARPVVMVLQFPPRGGSAQVVRYLASEIAAAGWSVSLVAGSVGGPGELGYGPEFFVPLPITPVDYTPAMRTWAVGGDPLAGSRPLHPPFEDRAGAPDRVFASLDDADFARQVACWSTALVDGGLRAAGVAHLHHLTPINEAVTRLRPDLPVGVSLHGTEVSMLEAIGRHEPATASWVHREAWSGRLRAWAARADRLMVDSPADATRALGLFDAPKEWLVVVAPGVDHDRFRPQREHGLRASLLVWGGFPGEWEGQHPVSLVRAEHIPGVYFTGWRGHDELQPGWAAPTCSCRPRSGRPSARCSSRPWPAGCRSWPPRPGALSFVNDDPTSPNGWLVTPDDEAALAAALSAATTGPTAPTERARRARRARRAANALVGRSTPHRRALLPGQHRAHATPHARLRAPPRTPLRDATVTMCDPEPQLPVIHTLYTCARGCLSTSTRWLEYLLRMTSPLSLCAPGPTVPLPDPGSSAPSPKQTRSPGSGPKRPRSMTHA